MLEIPDRFQSILRAHLPYAETGGLTARDELSALGLDSMGVVRLLVDIENRYAVELPDEILDEATFATVGSLWGALSMLMTIGPDRPRAF
ncbi:phosphopantetheine-binding protein [Streptosporangium sp. DT93]|uniref:phosphopantetheine-binding protein n=1 Tax=Streptosporangium sp. DT93 TaxID=3393428 RepID=UPI00361AFF88